MKPPIWLWFLLPLTTLLWSGQAVFSAYAHYRRAVAAAQVLEREVEALTKSLPGALSEAPVKEGELPQLYEALVRLAVAQGLALKSLRPQEVAQVGEARAWSLEMTLEGPYPGVLAYLEALPQVPAPLWVERYRLAPVAETRGERLTLELALRILAP